MDAETRWTFGRSAPQSHSRIGSVFAKDVVVHAHVAQFGFVIVEVSGDAFERVESCFLRGHSFAHVLDDSVCAGDANVFFARASGACRTYVLVTVISGAD